MENITEKDCEAKILHAKLKLRFRYCVGILLAIIILIFAYFFSENENLVNIVSFAATLASIILSVLAIFMTVLSNDTVGNLINRFRDTCDNIGTINNTVKTVSIDIKASSEKFEAIQPTLNMASDSITKSVEKLKDSTTTFQRSNELIKDTLEQFEGRLKNGIVNDVAQFIETKKTDLTIVGKGTTPQNSVDVTQLDRVEYSSYSGFCAILLLIYSSKYSTMVNLYRFGNEILKNKDAGNYLHGFCVGLSSINLLKISDEPNELYCNIDYDENLENYFKQKLKERAEEISNDEDTINKQFYSSAQTDKMILNIENFAMNGDLIESDTDEPKKD